LCRPLLELNLQNFVDADHVDLPLCEALEIEAHANFLAQSLRQVLLQVLIGPLFPFLLWRLGQRLEGGDAEGFLARVYLVARRGFESRSFVGKTVDGWWKGLRLELGVVECFLINRVGMTDLLGWNEDWVTLAYHLTRQHSILIPVLREGRDDLGLQSQAGRSTQIALVIVHELSSLALEAGLWAVEGVG